MYVQISRTLSRYPPHTHTHTHPHTHTTHTRPSLPFTQEVKEKMLPCSCEPDEVMRFLAPCITVRMRNLIIKERHVAVRKICLFFSSITPRNKGDPHALFIKSPFLSFIKVNYHTLFLLSHQKQEGLKKTRYQFYILNKAY